MPRAKRRGNFRRRQQTSSIVFLLWTVFSIFALVIVIGCSVGQQYVFRSTFKEQAAREVAEKGKSIRSAVVMEPPADFGENNINAYIRYLNHLHDVEIFVLDEQGRLMFPQDLTLEPSSPEYEEYYDFTKQLARLKTELRGKEFAVYEGDDGYIYGAEISLYGGNNYLYVRESLQLMQDSLAKMTGRTVLFCIFVFVFAFAVSAAVAGWLVNPLIDLTEKAHRLAEGDFAVDFHGRDYGRELVELADTLNYARDELSKTDRMQKELIANVSHDFKTPLTMIKGYASMIIEISGDVPEKRNKHAQVIVDEADRLASLVNDVLDLSKIRADMESLQEKEIDMSAYTYEILDRFAYLHETNGYQFIMDIEEGLYTCADERKIGQVLYNLIGNAVNYTGEDNKVYVSLKKLSDTVFRFSVRDTGKGIKPEELAGIWERYYRSKENHKRPVRGTGLGLSIVKTILERHRFRFGVDSKVGEGSVFYVDFPLLPPNA